MIVLCDEVTCAVCGHTGQLPSIGHWEAEGPWGLDNRPPEPMLSHLALLVQACPDRGYCAGRRHGRGWRVADIVRGEVVRDTASAIRCPGGLSALSASGAHRQNAGERHGCCLGAHPCRLAV